MVSFAAPVAGSMRVTFPSAVLATHTAPPPTATALAPWPTGIAFWTTPARSITETVSSRSSTTHVAPSPSAMAAGSLPTATVPSTSPEPVAMRATAEEPLDAHNEPDPVAIGLGTVSEPVAGLVPKGIRLTGCPKAGSMRRAVASEASTVHRASDVVVRPSTLVPGYRVRTTRAELGAICETELSSRLATQRLPAPAAMSPGRTPTCTWPTTAPRAGSMTATEFGSTEIASERWVTSAITATSSPAQANAAAATNPRRRTRRSEAMESAGVMARGASSDGSWRRIASFRSRSARLGSRPSSSTSALRVSWKTAAPRTGGRSGTGRA
jgi:hypothetical protein